MAFDYDSKSERRRRFWLHPNALVIMFLILVLCVAEVLAMLFG